MKFCEKVIADFGGYDAAKKLTETEGAVMLHNIEALKLHLLNYRRIHNMYEVGDKVINLIGNVPYVYKVEQIDSDGSITIVRRPKPDQPHWTIKKSNDIRHATDIEIAQGYRS